jgi:hypothetical protein
MPYIGKKPADIIATAVDTTTGTFSGDIDVDGTTNLDVVDIDGAVNVAADVTIASTNKIIFNDASQFIQGASATVLDIAATDTIELTATNIAVVGTMGATGKITADAGLDIDNINIDGTTIALSSGDLTLDVSGDIMLDSDSGYVLFKDGGTEHARIFQNNSGDVNIGSQISDKDMKFTGNDGGVAITALTLDMSNAGQAIFNKGASFADHVYLADNAKLTLGGGDDGTLYSDGTNIIQTATGELTLDVAGDIILDADTGVWRFKDAGTTIFQVSRDGDSYCGLYSGVSDMDMRFQGNDGGSTVTALTLDMSDAGTAVFNNRIRAALASDGSPSYSFGDDTHTGMFSPDNDTIAFSTGGSEKMRITSAGNVGIGTTSPASITGASGPILDMAGSNPEIVFHDTGGTANSMSMYYLNDLLVWYGGGSENMRLDNSSNLTVAGALSKGSGSFKIDHPLPAKTETHNLVHSFIEGPQADLIYRGKVVLVDGSATVNIDTVSGMTEGTFVLLNTNTQCFTSNESGWTAVKGSVSGNTLTITSQESCTDTISWMVVGERHDQHMLDTAWTDENGKVIVEPLKE